jgi:cardiolipin synthase A/B
VTPRTNSLASLADQAFSRASDARLVEGNQVRLLRDGPENYPAWLEAIASARRYIHFENYIIRGDATGRRFADALIERADAGVHVRIVYDWFGTLGKASTGYWDRLREAGVEVRVYNPPRPDSPLGWLSRDHRKMISVDGEVAFVTGLCIGDEWAGDPERGIAPWRDTGVELRGPAVVEVERAFASIWSMLGDALPEEHVAPRREAEPADGMRVRIIDSVPGTAGVFRLDQLIATIARERLWLTDPYFAGTTVFVQALRAAAEDGVDVRLLVPHATDLPLLRPLSRAGYRALLEAGVRVFEWNGRMMHAKTLVADGRWSRVGSTNLNLASWLGNCELDAVIEDEDFGQMMEESFLTDLEHSTEVVRDRRHRLYLPRDPKPRRLRQRGHRARGSIGPAAAGALRIGNVVGAAVTNRRALEPVEGRIMAMTSLVLIALALLFIVFPALLVYPVAILFIWFAIALLLKVRSLSSSRK